MKRKPGRVAQSITYLTADRSTCLTSDQVVLSVHTYVEIDQEIISTAILLPSADSRRVFVIYKQKYGLTT